MQKIIHQITKKLALLVNKEIEFYTYEDLLATKIPNFVVERIRIVLEYKVRDEIGNFTNSWVDFTNKNVQDSWGNFIEQALSSSYIPKDHLFEFLKYAVHDIVNLLIEPRKNMGEFIFREDNVLNLKDLEYRCAQLTIYKHFGTAILMYMRKKRLESLTKVNCISLIQKIDTKLIATYTPKDWVRTLEQLFVLCDGKVDSKLLSAFFNDKNLPNIAEKFINYDKFISKSNFVSILSTKDVNVTYNNEQITEELTVNESILEDVSKNDIENPVPENETNLWLIDSASKQEIEGRSIEKNNDLAYEIYQNAVESLNALFKSENDEDPVSETKQTKNLMQNVSKEVVENDENNLSTLDKANEPFNDVTDSKAGKEELTNSDNQAKKGRNNREHSFTSSEEVKDTTSDSHEFATDSEQPMWAQFLSSDHSDLVMDEHRTTQRDSESPNEEADIIVNDTFEDEIFEDVGIASIDSTPKLSALRDLLDDRYVEFLEVIFKSKETEYESALITLSTCSNWKEASNFIQNDIFGKNNVDLLSGVAVDFTDRMHRYFHD